MRNCTLAQYCKVALVHVRVCTIVYVCDNASAQGTRAPLHTSAMMHMQQCRVVCCQGLQLDAFGRARTLSEMSGISGFCSANFDSFGMFFSLLRVSLYLQFAIRGLTFSGANYSEAA